MPATRRPFALPARPRRVEVADVDRAGLHQLAAASGRELALASAHRNAGDRTDVAHRLPSPGELRPPATARTTVLPVAVRDRLLSGHGWHRHARGDLRIEDQSGSPCPLWAINRNEERGRPAELEPRSGSSPAPATSHEGPLRAPRPSPAPRRALRRRLAMEGWLAIHRPLALARHHHPESARRFGQDRGGR